MLNEQLAVVLNLDCLILRQLCPHGQRARLYDAYKHVVALVHTRESRPQLIQPGFDLEFAAALLSDLPHSVDPLDDLFDATVQGFGRKNDPVRILLCSDVASEGLNLHYFCHRIIHFDMPWSLMTYLQRNGRVDRFGQTRRPIVLYLQTNAGNEKIRGDQRILEVLQRKDEQANTNLGDPLAFLDRYDAEQEAEAVAAFMAEGKEAAAVEQIMELTAAHSTANQLDLFNALMAGLGSAEPGADVPNAEDSGKTQCLFTGHYAFAKAVLELLQLRGKTVQWSADDAAQTLTLTAPPDLQARLRQIPREAQLTPYLLSSEKERVLEAMETARQAKAEEDTWPKMQYLWPQHPISEWLTDSIVSEFRGHKAPVIRNLNLSKGEMAFVLAGTVPNRKGQPVIVDWQVVVRDPAGLFHLEPFETFAVRAKLAAGKLPNAGQKVPEALQAALPEAVAVMRQHMIRTQQAFDVNIRPMLHKTLDDLAGLQARQMTQLTLDLGSSGLPDQIKHAKTLSRSEEIQREFEAYRGWVHATMETEPQPFLQVVAAVHHLEG